MKFAKVWFYLHFARIRQCDSLWYWIFWVWGPIQRRFGGIGFRLFGLELSARWD
jgi:hypothetical protein